jgi:undecaprenyl-diphosphatase
MTPFQAFILGIVQGATEFLPISSSGHLVLVPWLLNWHFDPSTAFIFDVLVQWGTILAVIIYFRRELLGMFTAALRGILLRRPFDEPNARLAWLILLATLPAAMLGLTLKPVVETTFDSPLAVSLFLLLTALIQDHKYSYYSSALRLPRSWVWPLSIGFFPIFDATRLISSQSTVLLPGSEV